ncbi:MULTISPECIES: hypothetical protein [Burkholderiaceae]|uniref:hypothetical protein n=1 Tax=Burkholderiaceae TaxID=119060 RepID=UPI001178687B|nr:MULTISPECIES: hypothetical protein [Burkholderiaceae]MBY4717517.1 hypothetical protein [Ralstonia mannitolilytica]MCW5156413.1 hypothetical protein [Burkholderia cenocepacia]
MNEHQIEYLQKAKDHAATKKGFCLSDEYKNNETNLLWKCEVEEHQAWLSRYRVVVCTGRWCPECGIEKQSKRFRNKNGLQEAIQYAESKGGQCLSKEYINAATKMLWKCSNQDHKPWMAKFGSFKYRGVWCPECGQETGSRKLVNKDAIQQAKEHARMKGGECLSHEYIRTQDNLIWKCSNPSHDEWAASFLRVVRNGNWCPNCFKEDKHISENRVRLIFETHFKSSFPSVWPAWNRNPWTNQLLELDGYCEEFNIAFEHDGEHHYELTRKNGIKELAYQKFKDEQKRKNCTRNGVLLINIPILVKSKRNDFNIFLDNVLNCCARSGLDMKFTPSQIQELSMRFYKSSPT